MLGLLLLLVPAIFLDPVYGYKNGKVTESCRSMKPGHGHPSQSLPSPYTVTVDKSTFSKGDQIKVTLSGSSTFKGFLIEARDMADLSGDAVGSFTLVDHYVSQLLNCGEIKFSSKGCGSTKSCLRDPNGCDPETDPKCYFLSFTSEEHSVLFELSGPTEGYVSFALSHDKWMGNDDVYLCVRADDYVNINPGYVTGRTHPTLDSQVHRILMSSTVLLTCVAFILPFVYRGGWSKHAGAHPFLGCTVMALAVLQLVMAIFRPHPNTPRRLIFNWMHWGTGTISRIIAAKNVKDDEVEIIDSALGETEGHMIKKIVLTVYICGNLAFLTAFLDAINCI
ncbi:UNVERIFIED_CONTAM: hypothetical protein FKN15_047321 [Acipenser sinensis]